MRVCNYGTRLLHVIEAKACSVAKDVPSVMDVAVKMKLACKTEERSYQNLRVFVANIRCKFYKTQL